MKPDQNPNQEQRQESNPDDVVYSTRELIYMVLVCAVVMTLVVLATFGIKYLITR